MGAAPLARAPAVDPALADSWTVAGADDLPIRLYAWKANRGRRDAVLWGHANGFAAGAYAPMLDELAGDVDVYAYDLRGHGGSGDPGPDYDRGMAADRLALDLVHTVAAVRRRHVGPLHFAGHSASGLGALRMGAVHGHAPFRSMTLFEPPLAPTPDHVLHAGAAAVGELLASRALRRKRILPDPADFAAGLAARPGFDRWRPDMLRAFATATLIEAPEGADGGGWRLRCPPEAEAATYRMTLDCSTFAALAHFDRPIQFVESDPTLDGVAPSWATTAQAVAARQAPKGRLARITGASHMMPFERPDAVRQTVTAAVAIS